MIANNSASRSASGPSFSRRSRGRSTNAMSRIKPVSCMGHPLEPLGGQTFIFILAEGSVLADGETGEVGVGIGPAMETLAAGDGENDPVVLLDRSDRVGDIEAIDRTGRRARERDAHPEADA